MENLTDIEKCKNLFKLYNESEGKIKANAMVSRAYVDKISADIIDEKVNAQMNSIKVGICNINPKFKEGSKNYDITKKLVSETLLKYEQALVELSKFYDGKIEQLILRKVELEASLVGAILNEEYLNQSIARKNHQKENDEVKKSVKDNIKSALEKIKAKRNNNIEVDPKIITNLLDQQEVAIELEQQLSNKIEKKVKDKNENKEFLDKIEKEIAMIDTEITRINDRKKESIYNAMEVGNKEIATTIRKPRVFKKITRFFVSRFNTSKVVETTIIEPLNLRIDNFRNSELSNMMG